MITYICTKCEIEQEEDQFRLKEDGTHNKWCKKCLQQQPRIRPQYLQSLGMFEETYKDDLSKEDRKYFDDFNRSWYFRGPDEYKRRVDVLNCCWIDSIEKRRK